MYYVSLERICFVKKGYRRMNTEVKCPECGAMNERSAMTCQSCGFPLERRKKKVLPLLLSIILALVSLGLLIKGAQTLNGENVRFYKSHYDECAVEKENVDYSARTSSGYFRLSYEMLVDEYQRMMDDDMEKIHEYQRQAYIFFASGGALMIIAAALLVIKKKR